VPHSRLQEDLALPQLHKHGSQVPNSPHLTAGSEAGRTGKITQGDTLQQILKRNHMLMN